MVEKTIGNLRLFSGYVVTYCCIACEDFVWGEQKTVRIAV
jgi:hypothetical protein